VSSEENGRLTLGDLLGFEGASLTVDGMPDLTGSDAYAKLQSTLGAKGGPMWAAVRERIPGQLSKLLDVDGVGLLVGAWNKAQELQEFRDEKQHPPNEVNVVSLAKHTVESKHRPSVELVANTQPIGRLEFEIGLSLILEGVELTIQAGRVKQIRPGRSTGTGKIECDGVELYKINKKLLTLPGTIDLGEGVLIPAKQPTHP
jgi:hypothetical protein